MGSIRAPIAQLHWTSHAIVTENQRDDTFIGLCSTLHLQQCLRRPMKFCC
jgi:hypothetical protein